MKNKKYEKLQNGINQVKDSIEPKYEAVKKAGRFENGKQMFYVFLTVFILLALFSLPSQKELDAKLSAEELKASQESKEAFSKQVDELITGNKEASNE